MKNIVCNRLRGVQLTRRRYAFLSALAMFAALLLGVVQGPSPAEAFAPACENKISTYKAAWRQYSRKQDSYWNKVARKKKLRRSKKRKGQKILRKDFVLTHPPTYQGPKRPKCWVVKKKPGKKKKKKKSTIGTVADFLAAAKRHYGFVPRPTNEKEYKRIYAREALSNGLSAEQVVGVYALETGGIGPFNRQSGIFPINYKCEKLKKPKGRPASTALGYAQLLAANSAVMVKENGNAIAKRLEFEALLKPEAEKKALKRKANILRRMAKDVKRGIRRYKNRNNWREFRAFAKTSKGYAVHAVNLDPDIGPLIQVQKLKKIVKMAEKRGLTNMSSAQLETMNLAGPGSGLAMMIGHGRGVPTANFFSRGGYSRNPVVKNLTGSGLVEKMAKIIEKRKKNCGAVEFLAIFDEVTG